MDSAIAFSCYTFHDVSIAIASDHQELSDALHARLRSIASARQSVCDIVFEFRGVSSPSRHNVPGPSGRTRPIHSVPLGQASYAAEQDQLYVVCDNRIRVLCDLRLNRTVVSYVRSDPQSVSLAAHAMFTTALSELLKRRRRFSVRVAGLGAVGTGLLFPSASDADKSMLIAALMKAGFDFVAEDMIFLEQNPSGLSMLPFPDGLGGAATALAPPCRPSAVVFPRATDAARSRIAKLNPDEALSELRPNVLHTEPRSSQEHLDLLTALVNGCGCYRLEMGRDQEDLPNLLRSLTNRRSGSFPTFSQSNQRATKTAGAV